MNEVKFNPHKLIHILVLGGQVLRGEEDFQEMFFFVFLFFYFLLPLTVKRVSNLTDSAF